MCLLIQLPTEQVGGVGVGWTQKREPGKVVPQARILNSKVWHSAQARRPLLRDQPLDLLTGQSQKLSQPTLVPEQMYLEVSEKFTHKGATCGLIVSFIKG